MINRCSSSTCRNGELCCLDSILDPVCIPIRRNFPTCPDSQGVKSSVKCLTNVHGCLKHQCRDGRTCCVDECNEPHCKETPAEYSSHDFESPDERRPTTRRTPLRRRTTTEDPLYYDEDAAGPWDGDSDDKFVKKYHRRKTTKSPVPIPVIHRIYYVPRLPMTGLLSGLLGTLPPFLRFSQPIDSSRLQNMEAAFFAVNERQELVEKGKLIHNIWFKEKLPSVLREP